ncbi:MAG: pentapeptide repeat-containing protein [Thermomicrobiales bacterium]|nr:pentapeptide repeat-containing protein [Thermomicrobiales bacterium]
MTSGPAGARWDDLSRALAAPCPRRRLLGLAFGAILAASRQARGAEQGGGTADAQTERATPPVTTTPDECFEGFEPGRFIQCVPTPETCRRGIELGSGVDLRECDLSHMDLRHAYLHSADLRYADVHRADLSGANLTLAFLSNAFLWSVDLTGANLFLAEIRDATMTKANLSRAFLVNANLTGSYLWQADLTGARLDRANLRNAKLRSATMEQVVLTGVSWNNTICPDGTNSDENDGTCCGHLLGARPLAGCS